MGEVTQLTIKCHTWYMHDFLKAVVDNIGASFPFNAAVIARF